MASQRETEFIKNRAGITPSQDALPYKVTTSDAEAYIQKKIDLVMSKSGNREEIPVTLTTYETGKKFFPFMIILPTSVLESKSKKSEINDIFLNDDGDNNRNRFRKEIWAVMKGFMFDKKDREAFQSVSWRRTMEINSRNIASHLVKFSTPKIMTFEKGGAAYVVVLIDPLRVFHDMLKGIDDSRSFYIGVEETRKLSSNNYEYRIARVLIKGQKNNRSLKESVIHALRDSVRSRR